MAFFGKEFIFDGVPSSKYNLYINSPNGGDFEILPASSDVEIFTQRVYRRPRVYYYGTSQSPVLEFDLEVTSPEEITSVMSQSIQSWLFGKQEYAKLQIIQNDMQTIYFNCFLTSPQVIKSGRMIHGFSSKVICDSPFAWEFPKTFTRTYSDPIVSEIYSFYNYSDDSEYMYPNMIITMNATGGDISIINSNDNSREFLIEELSPNEVITINNELGIMTSSTGLRRLSNFNKKWMRFVKGVNTLSIAGNIGSIAVTYQLARKVGT